MKTIILAAALLVTGFASKTFAQAADKMNPGDNLPGVSTVMRNANGKNISLKDAAGENGLLVMFSCNTCPFVVKNQETTRKVMEYAQAHKVGMIIINSNEAKRGDDDSYNAMKKYAQDQRYTVPYVMDDNSALADLFGANHTPEVFLFNKRNKLVYKGAMTENASDPAASKIMYAQNAMDAMIAGKEMDPKTTKSVGCSIKRKA